MASKYLELRAKGAGRGRFRVPRGGGARTKGSFDTVDRYRQHSVAKRWLIKVYIQHLLNCCHNCQVQPHPGDVHTHYPGQVETLPRLCQPQVSSMLLWGFMLTDWSCVVCTYSISSKFQSWLITSLNSNRSQYKSYIWSLSRDPKSSFRDPKSINSHVYLPWTKVVSEPTSYSKIFCKCSLYFGLFRFVIRPPWDVSANIYR